MKDKFTKLLAYMLIGFVQLYKAVYSSITPGNCRFIPTCSCYAVEALKNHGPMRGSWLTLRRIGRCNPWGGWGADPVPPVSAPTSMAEKSTTGDAQLNTGQ
ncbi:MAG: membrane protein insertion efficiency factor YidD [Rhodospirillales bacterium]|nr:membrane protein insertion efficiency factor YidD [Rhodospirillales bacterium]